MHQTQRFKTAVFIIFSVCYLLTGQRYTGSSSADSPIDELVIWLYSTNYFSDYLRGEEINYDTQLIKRFETALLAENIQPVFHQNPRERPSRNAPYLYAVDIPQENSHDFLLAPYTNLLPSSYLTASYDEATGIHISDDEPNTVDSAIDYAIGLALYSLGRCDEALAYFQALSQQIEQFDDDPFFSHALTFYIATCMLAEGDLVRAVELYETITAPPPDLGYLWYSLSVPQNLSWAYFNLARTEEALHVFDPYLVPDFPDPDISIWALYKRSQLNVLAFRYDEAIADIDAAITINPNNLGLYVERGKHIMLLYKWDRALADFNYVINQNSTYADAYYFRGVLYASVPEGVEARQLAIADFQRYLELAPDGQHAGSAAENIASLQAQLDAIDS